MASSPLTGSSGVLRVSITSDGNPIPGSAQLISATVRSAVNQLPSATLVFADGNEAEQTFPLTDSAHLPPGAAIEVKVGDGATEATLFSGRVVRQGIRLAGGQGPRLTVECQHHAANVAEGQAVLAVEWGVDLLEFEAEVEAVPQPSGAPAPAEPARPHGRMRIQGGALAAVGQLIEVKGVGQRFSGPVVVAGVTHLIAEGGWTTEVSFGLPAGAVRKLDAELRTPGGNQVVLSNTDKAIVMSDQHGNKLELGAGGIKLSSLKDITLSAMGKVNISATDAVGIHSTLDVDVSGLNVNCTAQMGVVAKGSVTAELSASGQTTVKGAMVMIN